MNVKNFFTGKKEEPKEKSTNITIGEFTAIGDQFPIWIGPTGSIKPSYKIEYIPAKGGSISEQSSNGNCILSAAYLDTFLGTKRIKIKHNNVPYGAYGCGPNIKDVITKALNYLNTEYKKHKELQAQKYNDENNKWDTEI